MRRKITNPIIKDTITFVKLSEETKGELSELELTLMPGGGPPLHYHTRFTETFIAVEGELEVLTDDGKYLLKPGESFTVPIGVVHRFHNATAHEIKFRAVLHPGSEGFESALRIVYGLAGDGLTDDKSVPKKFVHLAIMAELSDIHLPGLLRVLGPILSWVAQRAQRNGTVQSLLAKYAT